MQNKTLWLKNYSLTLIMYVFLRHSVLCSPKSGLFSINQDTDEKTRMSWIKCPRMFTWRKGVELHSVVWQKKMSKEAQQYKECV